MIQADYHVHTDFSTDSDTPAARQAKAAIAAGIRDLCITDHHDPGYADDVFCLDLDRYYPAIQQLAADCRPQLCIRTGIELGLRTDCPKLIEKAAGQYPWDFVIGSTHVVDGMDPYFPEYWKGKKGREALRRYYEVTLDNIRTFDCFDVYGHIDYIARYLPAQEREEYHPEEYFDIIEEILRELILRGKGIECNTAGFKYGMGHPNPSEEVLKRYFELGGEILTIGSDGHRPEHVAFAFDRLPALLSGCGCRYYTIYDGRKPRMIPLA